MVQVYAERRYRVRASMRTPVAATPEVDMLLVALHKRPGATTDFLGGIMRSGAQSAMPILLKMSTNGLVIVPGVDLTDKKAVKAANLLTASWKLTSSGAKMAIFALHRERARAPRTTFVGGINPWTGQPMRC